MPFGLLESFEHLERCLGRGSKRFPYLSVRAPVRSHPKCYSWVNLCARQIESSGFSSGRDVVIGIPLNCSPFQILWTIIRSIRVDVVGNLSILGRSKECGGYEPMNSERLTVPIVFQGYLSIALYISVTKGAGRISNIAEIADLEDFREMCYRHWLPYFHSDSPMLFMDGV